MPLSFLLLASIFAALCASASQLPDVPGLTFVGRGLDITTMALYRSNSSSKHHQDLEPILDNTYTYNMTWTNPVTKKTYRLPDMMLPNDLSSTKYTNSTQSFNGVESFQIWREHTTHWHTGLFGMDSHSKTTYHFLERLFQHGETLAESQLIVQFLKLEALPLAMQKFSPAFTMAIKLLPKTCCNSTSDYKEYREFFSSFGTAMMSSAHLGGRLRCHTWFASCLLNKTTVNWVEEQSSWSFLGLINGGHNNGHQSHKVSKGFSDCAHSDVVFEGGDATAFRIDQWKEWIATVFDAPYPVKYQLVPITDVIAQARPELVAPMQTALKQYLYLSQKELNATEAAMAKNATPPSQKCCG